MYLPTDFENAGTSAFKLNFPNVVNKSCHFDFFQCLLHKFVKLGK